MASPSTSSSSNKRIARFSKRAEEVGLTSDELAQRKTDLDGKLHLRTLSPMTLAGHTFLIDLCVFYLNQLDPGAGDRMQESGLVDTRLNDIAHLKNVLRSSVELSKAVSKGKKAAKLENGEEAKSLRTTLGYATSLSSALKRFGAGPGLNGFSPPPDISTLSDYVLTDLRSEYNLTTIMRDKFTCNKANLDALYSSIYKKEIAFHDSRECLQFHAACLLSLFGGCRPSELFPRNLRRDEKYGLKYKDFEIVVEAAQGDPAPTIVVRIRLGNLKGHDGDESVFKRIPLHHALNPFFDAASIFLSLATLDQVFDDGAIEKLFSLSTDAVVKYLNGQHILKPKEEKGNIAVLRKFDLQNGVYVVSPSESMPYERWCYLLEKAGTSAGFTKKLVPYDFRRTAADLANDPAVGTSADLMRLLNHSSLSTTVNNQYTTTTVQVDISSAAQGLAVDRKRMKVGEGIEMVNREDQIDPDTLDRAVFKDADVVKARKEKAAVMADIVTRHKSLAAARTAKDSQCSVLNSKNAQIEYAVTRARKALQAEFLEESKKRLLERAYQSSTSATSSSTSGASSTQQRKSSTEKNDSSSYQEQGRGGGEDSEEDFDDPVSNSPGARLVARSRDLSSTDTILATAAALDENSGLNSTTSASITTSSLPSTSADNRAASLSSLSTVFASPDNELPLSERVKAILSALKASASKLGSLSLDQDNRCRVCQKVVKGSTDQREHVEKCVRATAITVFRTAALEEVGSDCPFDRCRKPLEGLEVNEAKDHFMDHVKKKKKGNCGVQGCSFSYTSVDDYQVHLETEHAIVIRDERGTGLVLYCSLCDAWVIGATCQMEHAEQHLSELEEAVANGLDVTTLFRTDSHTHARCVGGKLEWVCPCCVFDTSLGPLARWVPVTTPRQLNCHFVTNHLRLDPPFSCSHNSCSWGSPSNDVDAYTEYGDHLVEVHHMRVAGVIPDTKVSQLCEGDPTRLKAMINSTDKISNERIQQLIDRCLGPLKSSGGGTTRSNAKSISSKSSTSTQASSSISKAKGKGKARETRTEDQEDRVGTTSKAARSSKRSKPLTRQPSSQGDPPRDAQARPSKKPKLDQPARPSSIIREDSPSVPSSSSASRLSTSTLERQTSTSSSRPATAAPSSSRPRTKKKIIIESSSEEEEEDGDANIYRMEDVNPDQEVDELASD